MFNGAQSPECINAYRQEMDRKIDRSARELEVQRILASSGAAQEADLRGASPRWSLATIVRQLWGGNRMEPLSGS